MFDDFIVNTRTKNVTATKASVIVWSSAILAGAIIAAVLAFVNEAPKRQDPESSVKIESYSSGNNEFLGLYD
ncbi:MAG: hypothetical protein COU81_02455 [Candidatus Portnoybacteria bacterium CG10_big_fil_rev_8_21_14_0_10_36_7]|uniref:Uncharacterized protein n=1 Tax=Candidatus Portnoybacteria bacterium CG10_big_fil_rev_8_21_14_0_10_36_7 TaxID=1974812 RepID=A0A2M8KDV4_9BACT|nr:MAG: hypothetical protein COU81_02455 [Candidatus Portnoybacteria bacterium CG10_big_fil_rev_8_21_14_0_10_36_7]